MALGPIPKLSLSVPENVPTILKGAVVVIEVTFIVILPPIAEAKNIAPALSSYCAVAAMLDELELYVPVVMEPGLLTEKDIIDELGAVLLLPLINIELFPPPELRKPPAPTLTVVTGPPFIAAVIVPF